MDKQELVNAVIEEMKKDFYDNDWDAIDAFLYNVDTKLLQGFLRLKASQTRKNNYQYSETSQ